MHILEFLEYRRHVGDDDPLLTESSKSKKALKRIDYARELIKAAEKEDRETVARSTKENAARAALMAVKDLALDMGMKGVLGSIRKVSDQLDKESRS